MQQNMGKQSMQMTMKYLMPYMMPQVVGNVGPQGGKHQGSHMSENVDLGTDDLSELTAVDKQPKLIYPDIILEIPDIQIEDMYDGLIWSIQIREEEKPQSYDEDSPKARENADLATIEQARGVNKKEDEGIVIDDTDGDIKGNLVQGVCVK